MEVQSLFAESFPVPFLEDLIRSIYASCAYSVEFSRRYRPAEAFDVIGHVRHAEVEARITRLARVHKGYRVKSYKNKRGSAHHRVIQAPGIWLTASAVEHRLRLPRTAIFRQNLTLRNQGELFPSTAPAKPSKQIYGIVLYGMSTDKRFPYFVDVVFPTPGYARNERVRLLERFPALVNELVTPKRVSEETVGDEALPKIKKVQSKEETA